MFAVRLLAATIALTISLCAALPAQQPAADSSILTLDRIYASAEFRPERLGEVRWLPDRPAYLKLEADSASGSGGAPSLVRYDAATGKREVVVPPARMVPPGDSAPLPVEDYDLSADGKRLLIFTNSRKVWRQNTRGDFYALDLTSWKLTRRARTWSSSSSAICRPASLCRPSRSPVKLRTISCRPFTPMVEKWLRRVPR